MATCLFDFNWWLCAVEASGNCFTSPVASEESDGKASQSASTTSHACPCSQSSAFSASSRSGIPSKKVSVSASRNDCLRSLTKQLAFSSASMDNTTSHRSSRWCNTRAPACVFWRASSSSLPGSGGRRLPLAHILIS